MNKKHAICKIYAFFLAICLLLQVLPITFNAEETERLVPRESIRISTAEELVEFAENCRLNTWSEGISVVLKKDIDLSGVEFNGIPVFSGSFYGQGHTIKGISITSDGSVLGFFRYLEETAIVYDLNLEGEITPGGTREMVGGIAGENAGTIINCSFFGTISGGDRVGGLVGSNESTGLIEDGTFSGVLSGNHFLGGIAGENHGVIRTCTNEADINAEAVQNNVSLEDITIDDLVNTEYASTSTDIGGIAGANHGVIRESFNYGSVGYASMGYNIGGIAGSQKGYIADCVNYAKICGRKEIGGIVGQMEPNIVLTYSTDTLQILSGQMDVLSGKVNNLKATVKDSSDEFHSLTDDLDRHVQDAQNAMDSLTQGAISEEEWDLDKSIAAANDLSGALQNIINTAGLLNSSVKGTSAAVTNGTKDVLSQVSEIGDTLSNAEANFNTEMKDISDYDTEEDTLGKVVNCINYGDVKADLNAGGIAGAMAEENDLDILADIIATGEISLNYTYHTRTVVRSCKNYGTVSVGKQMAGGIAGRMDAGCVMESVNLGNLDAAGADYVGGIAGESSAIIRNSSSKSIISGDAYVGGIAGKGKIVTDCYAFVQMKSCSESFGGILGNVETLSNYMIENDNNSDADIRGNYYFIDGKDLGAIDGISYFGAAEPLSLEDFLALEGLDEGFKKVTVRFCTDGHDDIVVTLMTGEILSLDEIPSLSVVDGHDGQWLGLEEAKSEPVLFDKTFTAFYNDYHKVVESEQKDYKGLAILLAEGEFPSGTSLEITDMLEEEDHIDGRELFSNWKVSLDYEGDVILHYLLPEDADAEKVQLLVAGDDGRWEEREFSLDGMYLIFEFADGDEAFCLAEAPDSGVNWMIAAIVVLILVLIVIGMIVIKNKKKKIKSS